MQITGRIAIAVGALALVLTGCGDDDPPANASSSTTQTASDAAATPTDAAPTSDAPTSDAGDEATGDPADGAVGSLPFRLVTADGSIEVDGTAEACDNPDEANLATSFTDGTTTVTVNGVDGAGSITISGGTQFEGRIDSLMVGDAGNVAITGHGALADDAATPTGFTIEGSCAG
ncbi:hypothetical protein E8D34_13205 [Nocardioides sp. GY 10113]|uniref:hypothetical protein n=1 Tax=Nocardioides sp. GY 10113 TaxID=2569761 RepID=UPI0010A80738|nr:hypothetical protein [Nocardioides sp. GY 10113]TIC85035.1 hypothetical protein E8D34_13205 [Nocardioides sp. GY 10113]